MNILLKFFIGIISRVFHERMFHGFYVSRMRRCFIALSRHNHRKTTGYFMKMLTNLGVEGYESVA